MLPKSVMKSIVVQCFSEFIISIFSVVVVVVVVVGPWHAMCATVLIDSLLQKLEQIYHHVISFRCIASSLMNGI